MIDPDDNQLTRAVDEVTAAVLYLAYSNVANGGRETAGQSHDHDYAYDRVDEAIEALMKLAATRERTRLRAAVTSRLMTALGETDAAKRVLASPAAGNQEWQNLHERRGVQRGLAKAVELIDGAAIAVAMKGGSHGA